ncbi:Transcription initiation factor IIF subunit alpha [Aphelenchoides fujianensis]|nr:Transcription initiation factor IIF subunit alpha [Aphelenchoides fujianensis]
MSVLPPAAAAAAVKPKTEHPEYKVVVPASKGVKKYSILQFNGPLKVDPGTWTRQVIQMAREDNRAHTVGPTEIKQDYGQGSEYGRAAREEQRRKKYGRQARTYHHDRQPWQLTIREPKAEAEGGGSSTATTDRVFRSVCEGGAGEHSDYWVFLKAGNNFHAHKVDDWYRFMPMPRHRTLDIDQAEEEFQHRNKVLNQFALKAQIQQKLKDADEDGGRVSKPVALKIKDEGSSDEDGEEDETSKIGDANADPNAAGKKGAKGKKKANGREAKEKRQRVQNGDEVAAYESEDGEDEGREYDYISDSGSDTSREDMKDEEKMDRDLVAVGDETGMRDESEDSEEENSNDAKNEDANGKRKLLKRLKQAEQEADGEEGDDAKKAAPAADEKDSSGSDSDDPDSPKGKTSLKDRKRQLMDEAAAEGSDAKRAKSSREATPAGGGGGSRATSPAAAAEPQEDRLDHATVRRFLSRRPHTTKELITKLRPFCQDIGRSEIVARLADILRDINPHQFRQHVRGKEVLFFSMNPAT